MNDLMRDGDEGARVDEAVLRRLIAEGGRAGSGRRGQADQPSDQSLRALATLLNTMAEPSSGPDERKGEEAAVAAFLAARAERATALPAEPNGVRGRLARLARRLGRPRTGALGVVVAAVLGSGVAVAAGGVAFLGGDDPDGRAGSSPVPVDTAPAPAPGGAPAGRNSASAQPHTGASGDARASASPKLVKLCRSHQEKPSAKPGKPLVAAAGGGDRVDAYCAELLSALPAGAAPGGGNRGNGSANGNPGNANSNPGSANGNPGNANSNPGSANGNPGNANSNPGSANGNPGNANSGGTDNGNPQNPGGEGQNPGSRNGGNQGNGNSNANGRPGSGNQGRADTGGKGDNGNGNRGNGNGAPGSGDNGNGKPGGGAAPQAAQGRPDHPVAGPRAAARER
ncbi:hypothetical protein V1L54_08235 [Streptomyces sp. TRM 70361]|uniref:hypothetical protein n=1 Tax=Streptomyces sp. TRM 70361 TaxID=3116553 RepID=UPI002E7C2529|nr:hypothetical protein [Streptomyces sp. TRM 70361]MEE1939402.1 hypothetical protein [Streptomyces sp. TRM 70361]